MLPRFAVVALLSVVLLCPTVWSAEESPELKQATELLRTGDSAARAKVLNDIKLLVALPKLLRLFVKPIFGMPHEAGSVILTGKPIILAFTSSLLPSSWPMTLNSELYPKRASFTLVAERIRVFAITHWLARV